MLANSQVNIELNSTSDNPLVDFEKGEIYIGANFQAASVTSAMKKARNALQILAKMLFSQKSELINSMYNIAAVFRPILLLMIQIYHAP